MPSKCFRCVSEYHLVAKFLNPPKENYKCKKQVCFNEKGNRASQKECKNGENNNDQKIYASMARMSDNNEFPCRNSADNSQLTNWILVSGATFHMTPEV